MPNFWSHPVQGQTFSHYCIYYVRSCVAIVFGLLMEKLLLRKYPGCIRGCSFSCFVYTVFLFLRGTARCQYYCQCVDLYRASPANRFNALILCEQKCLTGARKQLRWHSGCGQGPEDCSRRTDQHMAKAWRPYVEVVHAVDFAQRNWDVSGWITDL